MTLVLHPSQAEVDDDDDDDDEDENDEDENENAALSERCTLTNWHIAVGYWNWQRLWFMC